MIVPTATLADLHGADGSTTYSRDGYTVIGAVNGPLEVGRRDELPQEATLEVHIRPAAGVGTTKERHLEALLHSTLRHTILTHAYPRSLIQLTLQVVGMPDEVSASGLPVSPLLLLLPSLLNASILALLNASIQLRTIYTSALICVTLSGTTASPSFNDLRTARSLHVFAFEGAGKLILAESEGGFEIGEWELACAAAKRLCLGEKGGTAMKEEEEGEGEGKEGAERGLKEWVRGLVAGQS